MSRITIPKQPKKQQQTSEPHSKRRHNDRGGRRTGKSWWLHSSLEWLWVDVCAVVVVFVVVVCVCECVFSFFNGRHNGRELIYIYIDANRWWQIHNSQSIGAPIYGFLKDYFTMRIIFKIHCIKILNANITTIKMQWWWPQKYIIIYFCGIYVEKYL